MRWLRFFGSLDVHAFEELLDLLTTALWALLSVLLVLLEGFRNDELLLATLAPEVVGWHVLPFQTKLERLSVCWLIPRERGSKTTRTRHYPGAR